MATLPLNLTGRLFTLMPLSSSIESACAVCGAPASHRLYSRAAARAERLCDQHTIEFAREHGEEASA